MIFITLNQNYKEAGLSPILLKVVDFLKENKKEFETKEVGTYEICGNDIYYQIIETKTEDFQNRDPESHKLYLDVQLVVKGEEKIGITPLKNDYKIKEYIESRDLIFYESIENEGYLYATEGCISIFYPEDIHRPQIAVQEPQYEKKVVVKVKKNLLK